MAGASPAAHDAEVMLMPLEDIGKPAAADGPEH